MCYTDLIEDIREELIQLVNLRCDSMKQLIEAGSMSDESEFFFSYKLMSDTPSLLKGKKPLAVRFGSGEGVKTETWKKVAEVILRHCNEQPEYHKKLAAMCNKVAGQQRVILSTTPEHMNVPLEVAENIYFELKYDTETLLKVLVNKVLVPIGYDIGEIVIDYRPSNIAQLYESTEQHKDGITMQGI